MVEKPAATPRPARPRKRATAAAPVSSNTPAEAPKVQSRIVVGIDTNFMAREALALAARLAASVDARLKGVFVEDENLLSLCGLPFAREISFSGEVRGVDHERMLRAMRAQAETARRVLQRIASEAHVDWSFDVARGRPLALLAASANAEDTLVIRAPDASAREVGRAVRAAQETRADVLLVARGVAAKGLFGTAIARPDAPGIVPRGARPIAAVDDGSSLGQSCAAFAETLAARTGLSFHRLHVRGRDPAEIAAAARAAHAGLIVINAGWLGGDDDAARLSAAAGCPLLLLGAERIARTAPPTT
ncbi:hypothetical protein [Parvibaculum sp.]|uniref:hypothetical protein n=1 Tax=Parvibaculum sp. TaxID=2024848 RepID=UPI002CB26FD4|nr:hypothetical protein [Parvibaculum sp.]HUD52184.1 hypothetical protein [Parvibaculum sp.]